MIKFFFFFLTPILVCAQQTKEVLKLIDYAGLKQIYSVIDFGDSADNFVSGENITEVMHGKFQSFHHDTLLAEGFMKFGMRDSMWEIFNISNGELSGRGMYYYDHKDGWWTYYSKKEIPYLRKHENTGEKIILDSVLFSEMKNTDSNASEFPPEFIGGEDSLMNFLGKNIHYPIFAKENNIQGRVYITFLINRSGKVTFAKILRGIGGGCDEEALRVINLTKNMWRPGYQNGQAVAVQYNLPVVFNLKGGKK